MTDGDRFQFAQSFTRLAVALRLPATKAPDALKTQMRVYFEALRDLPFPAIEESVTVLQRQGSGFFPSTQEWYRVADDLAYARLLDADARRPALPAPARSDDAFTRAKAARQTFLADMRAKGTTANGMDWGQVADAFERKIPSCDPDRNPYASWCADCDDTGWLSHDCRDGNRCDQHADVDAAWGEHEHVSRCGCRAMNPTIQRRLSLARRK